MKNIQIVWSIREDETSDLSAVAAVLDRALTQAGSSIVELSIASPVLLVFLRHPGCTFCREALRDIADARAALEARASPDHSGAHGRHEFTGAVAVKVCKLSAIDRIFDPDRDLYRAFGLKRGSFGQLFGMKVIWRSLLQGVLLRFGMGRPSGDAFQMLGMFLIHQSAVIGRFRHRSAADRPDYLGIGLST